MADTSVHFPPGDTDSETETDRGAAGGDQAGDNDGADLVDGLSNGLVRDGRVRRLRHPLRKLAIVAAIVLCIYLFYAWVFGLPAGPLGDTVHLHPLNGLRSFFSAFPEFLSIVLPMLLTISLYMLIIVGQFAALFWFLSRGRTYIIYPGEFDVGFDDVRGQPAVVDSTREALEIFRGFKDFRRLGGYPPHGILFEGPPGTGKTLLGKAVAGEAGVPFMYASATSFQNMFMGISSMRIWALFKKARKYSVRYGGVVMFIDEIDAFGSRGAAVSGARSVQAPAGDGVTPRDVRKLQSTWRMIMGGMGSGGDRTMLNELLTQMDGMDSDVVLRGLGRNVRRMFGIPPKKAPQTNVLVIGATNMAEALDPALLRPGRFDRKIYVGKPAAEGRLDVIDYYLGKVAHDEIDTDRLANLTIGYSPAQIKNVINEGLIFALRDGREKLNLEDILQAKLADEIGLEDAVTYSSWERESTAIHEAGHAVAAWLLMPHEDVQVITVQKRGSTLGLVDSRENEERFSQTGAEMRAGIKVLLAGMAAEQIWYGDVTSGPSSDLAGATRQAVRMISFYGMGDSLISAGADAFGPGTISELLKDQHVRSQVDELLAGLRDDVTAILRDKAHCVEALRDKLLEQDLVTGEEFAALMEAEGEGVRMIGVDTYRHAPRDVASRETGAGESTSS